MKLTDTEAKELSRLMRDCTQKLREAGASAVLILESHEDEHGGWDMYWSHAGNPYACVEMARRFQMLDSHKSLAHYIGREISSGSEGDEWKHA